MAIVLLVNNFLIAQTSTNNKKSPRDGFYKRYLYTEKRALTYDFIHEKDVFWEKRLWREIMLGEKMNQAFKNPNAPFVEVLLNAAKMGGIAA